MTSFYVVPHASSGLLDVDGDGHGVWGFAEYPHLYDRDLFLVGVEKRIGLEPSSMDGFR